MRIRTLIYCIGVVCALITACGPVVTQAPVGGAPPPSLTCDSNSTGAQFVAAKVYKLSAGFNPKLGLAPTSAEILENVSTGDPYYQVLTDAFSAAPPFFKDNLCSLTQVFIVQNNCTGSCTPADLINNSWGLRAYQTAGAPKYIATSQQLLLMALSLGDFETQRLMYMLSQFVSTGAAVWTHHPTYLATLPTSNDPFAFTVLAAFAHEYGHVLWYDTFVSQPGGNIDHLATFCQGKNKYNSFYPPGHWDKISLSNNRWITFAQKHEKYHIDHFIPLQNALDTGGLTGRFYPKADKELQKALMDNAVVDLLSVFSSNEDFVTAYELDVLKEAQLSALKVQMYDDSGTIDPNYGVNILGKLGSGTDLYEKVKCF
jgi:hypothetical protein